MGASVYVCECAGRASGGGSPASVARLLPQMLRRGDGGMCARGAAGGVRTLLWLCTAAVCGRGGVGKGGCCRLLGGEDAATCPDGARCDFLAPLSPPADPEVASRWGWLAQVAKRGAPSGTGTLSVCVCVCAACSGAVAQVFPLNSQEKKLETINEGFMGGKWVEKSGWKGRNHLRRCIALKKP